MLEQSRPDVFGSDEHEFLLNGPLSQEGVAEFERLYGVCLPSDYRQFLLEVGNGGAGPFYGVFPLGYVDDNFGIKKWTEFDGLVGDLSEPFTLIAPWNDLSKLPSDGLLEQNPDEHDRRMESFDKIYRASALLNGALPICHEGCALRIYLVLTGAEAGHLWEDRRSEREGIRPMHDRKGSPLTFTRWYENWLEQCVDAAGLG